MLIDPHANALDMYLSLARPGLAWPGSILQIDIRADDICFEPDQARPKNTNIFLLQHSQRKYLICYAASSFSNCNHANFYGHND